MKYLVLLTAVMGWGCSPSQTAFSSAADAGGVADASDDESIDTDGTLADATLAADASASPADIGLGLMDAAADMALPLDAAADMALPLDAMADPAPLRVTCERVDAEGRRTDRWVLDDERPILHDAHGPFVSLQGDVIPPSVEPSITREWRYDADGNMTEERERRPDGDETVVRQGWNDGLLIRRDRRAIIGDSVFETSTTLEYAGRLPVREIRVNADDDVLSDTVTTYDMQDRRVRITNDWSTGRGDTFRPADGNFDLVTDYAHPEPTLELFEKRPGLDAPVDGTGSVRRDDRGQVLERLVDLDADGVVDRTLRYRYEGDLIVYSEAGLGDPESDEYVAQVATFTYTPTRKTMWVEDEVYAQTDCSAPIDFNRLKAP